MLKLDLDLSEENKNYITLPINKIKSREQGRKTFTNLRELADEFLNPEIGQIQPIAVTEADENGIYYITAGERRWRAAKLAELDTIDCVIKNDNPLITFSENMRRENLTIFEIGGQLKLIQEHYNASNNEPLNNNELAKIVNYDSSWVSRHLKIHSTDDKFKALCKKGNITAISIADDLEKIYSIKPKIAERLVEKGVTRPLLKEYLKKLKGGIDTRVRQERKKLTPILGITNDIGNIEKVTLYDESSVTNGSGKVIQINLSEVFVIGVK